MNSLDNYKSLCKFLATSFGPHYQIVLYDATKEGYPIYDVENGIVLPVNIGDHANKQIQELLDNYNGVELYNCNFDFIDHDNKNLRASVYYIKDETTLIGALAIYFNDKLFLDIAQNLLKLVHPDDSLIKRNDYVEDDDIKSKIYKIIEEYLSDNHMLTGHYSKYEFDNKIAHLSQDTRIAIVSKLEKKQIFKIKGALSEVANILQMSEPSIYRYLNKIKKEG
jgi:predicted transcriptional regulator YheO